MRQTLERYAGDVLGSHIGEVILRAGRIDAVWAVRLLDGRSVVIKAHRQPVDQQARRATVRAQSILSDAGFPCPAPISGSAEFEGLTLTTETFMTQGSARSGRDPLIRRALAQGLSEHIEILRSDPGLVDVAGFGPAWCRYQSGPWPTPHDIIFDFTATPAGWEWLDRFAADAAKQVAATDDGDRVVGHGDWYCGNVRFIGKRLASTFDWDLVSASEPVIAGFAAATFTEGGAHEQGAAHEPDVPTPQDVVAFLADYESYLPRQFTAREQAAAAAAASWTLAYNARCELAFLRGAAATGSGLDLVRRRGAEYLALRW